MQSLYKAKVHAEKKSEIYVWAGGGLCRKGKKLHGVCAASGRRGASMHLRSARGPDMIGMYRRPYCRKLVLNGGDGVAARRQRYQW